jgi:alanine dehydrogenase
MSETPHFSRQQILAVDPRLVADALAAGLAMVSRGAAVAPVRGHIDFGDGAGTYLISGALTELDLLTVKVINVRPANAARGLERLQGSLAVFEASTGRLLATLDAKAATEARTAACSAVSMRLMARGDARVLTIFGSGPQALAHERALRAEHDFDEVRIVRRGDLSVLEALRGADVVVTATNSATPLFPAAAIEPGTHVAMIGGGSHANTEVEPALLGRASAIRVDHRPSCLAEAGEIVQAIEAGHISAADLSELGDVVLGRATGRTGPRDITIYKSVGNGTQDAALAALLLGVGPKP